MLDELRPRALALRRAVLLDPEAGAAAADEVLQALIRQPRSPALDGLRAIARCGLSAAAVARGDLAAAFDEALQAERLVDRCDDPTAQAIAWHQLAQVLYRAGHLDEAERWARKASELPRIPPELAVRALTTVAAMLRAEARLDEATVAFDDLMRWRGRVDGAMWCAALVNAASCYHQVDRAGDALEALEEARRVRPPDRLDLLDWIDTIEAWAAIAAGDLGRGVERAREALAPDRTDAIDRRSSAARALARAALTDARVRPEAIAAAEGLVVEAERQGVRQQALDLHLALVDLHEADDHLVAAVRHLREARRCEGLLAEDAHRLRTEREDLRLEVARLQVQADALRAHRRELAAANAALAAADAERARLIRTLAHDLRNPLMAVGAALDLINPFDPLDVREHLDRIEAAAGRMQAVLDGAVRPSTPAVRPAVDAAELADRTAQALRSLAERKGQRLVVESDPESTVHADPDAVGRILDNLVSNALKYSGEGTEARVRVTATESRVDLEVLDQGPGFPDLDAADGLLLGTQLATRTTGDEDSWGIGLHTVYRLVAEQGGILAVGNREEGGAVVRVSLPR